MSIYKASADLAQLVALYQAILDNLDATTTDHITDLDVLADTTLFSFNSDATGNPMPAFDGRGIHIEEVNGEASQIVIMGTEAILFRDRDKPDSDPAQEWGPWQQIYKPTIRTFVRHDDQVFDANWIIAANMFGDTAITVGDYFVGFMRIGDVVHVSGYIDVEDFSQSIPTDDSWSFEIDLGAIAAFEGIFTDIISEPYANTTVQFDAAGIDVMPQPAVGTIHNKDDASPNSVRFSGGQVDTGTPGGASAVTVDKATIRFTATIQVAD